MVKIHDQKGSKAMSNRQSKKKFIFRFVSLTLFIFAFLLLVQPINAQDSSGSTDQNGGSTDQNGGSGDQNGAADQSSAAASSTTAAAAPQSSTDSASSTSPTTASSTASSSSSANSAVPTISDNPFNKIGFPCLTNQSMLLTASNQLMTDCGYLAWCNPSTNTCDSRGCRRDEWPFGYSTMERSKWPPTCSEEKFCPDEGSYCMDKIALGGACQLDRDDECANSSSGQKVRCLHNTCTQVNATLNNACIHDNVVYTVFTPANASYGAIISRDNCVKGLYCDSPTSVCLQRKDLAASCSADKECMSDYCRDPGYTAQTPDNNDMTGTCAQQPNITASKHQVWVYPVIVVVALVVLGVLIVTLLKVHQSQGTRRRETARAYWESQRNVNEKARLLKEDIRHMSQPGTPRGMNGTFDGRQNGSRLRSYGAAEEAARGPLDESQRLLKSESIREGSSRHASYDGAYAQSSNNVLLNDANSYDQRHSKNLPRAPGETYLDEGDESMMNTTIAGMHGHQQADDRAALRRASHNIYSPLSDSDHHSEHSNASLMDSPRNNEAFLTPSQSQTRLSMIAAHDHSLLESNAHSTTGHDAARMYGRVDNTRRTSAQMAGVRNRESVARYAEVGSPDARRESLGNEWSFNQSERR